MATETETTVTYYDDSNEQYEYVCVFVILEECKEYAAAAAEPASNAAASATYAESYAVGGTGSRSGEDTDNSKYYCELAKQNADSAAASASAASTSEANAEASAKAAAQSEANAAASEASAYEYALGDTDSALYYYNLTKATAESLGSVLRFMGSIAFDDLPSISESLPGDLYNITDKFFTTDLFAEGEGFMVISGSDIYLDRDNKWNVIGGVQPYDVTEEDIDAIFA